MYGGVWGYYADANGLCRHDCGITAPMLSHQFQRLRIDSAARSLLPALDVFGPHPATTWTGP
eukprot:323009-Alexandrium_andersonii.AAC.1